MKTFTKEIKWASYEFDATQNESVITEKSKTATFKELNRTDKEQHKLHFKLISLFEGLEKSKDEEGSVGISSDGLYDITVKAINTLLQINQDFTEADKKEFLNGKLHRGRHLAARAGRGRNQS